MVSYEYELKNAYIGDCTGWYPTTNTLLYLPLTENANDYSGNGRNCTAYASVSFTSDGAYFSGSAYNTNFIEFPSSFYPGTSFTVSLWIKRGQNDRELRMFSDWGTNYRRILWATASNGYMNLLFGNGNTSQSDWGSIQTYSANTRYNYVFVKNGTSATLYRNGELVGTHTFSYDSSPGGLAVGEYGIGTIRTASSSHIPGTGYVKDYIIESNQWTAQEVQDYYNNTKDEYGPTGEITEEFTIINGQHNPISKSGYKVKQIVFEWNYNYSQSAWYVAGLRLHTSDDDTKPAIFADSYTGGTYGYDYGYGLGPYGGAVVRSVQNTESSGQTLVKIGSGQTTSGQGAMNYTLTVDKFDYKIGKTVGNRTQTGTTNLNATQQGYITTLFEYPSLVITKGTWGGPDFTAKATVTYEPV